MPRTGLFDSGAQPFWGDEDMLNWAARGSIGNDHPNHTIVDLSVTGQTSQHHEAQRPLPPTKLVKCSVGGPADVQPDPYLPWMNTPTQPYPNVFTDYGVEGATILDMTNWSQMDEYETTNGISMKITPPKQRETTIKSGNIKAITMQPMTYEAETESDQTDGGPKHPIIIQKQSEHDNRGEAPDVFEMMNEILEEIGGHGMTGQDIIGGVQPNEKMRRTLQSCYEAMEERKTLTKLICETLSELADRQIPLSEY